MIVPIPVGSKVTLSANPSDVLNNVGASVVNGPQYVSSNPAIVSVAPAPGVNSPTAELSGIAPGSATVTITGLPAAEGASTVSEVVDVTVSVGLLHHFAPTVSAPVPI